MTDSKITDLTELTTTHDSDYLVTVDLTDLSQSTSGTTKKITRANLLASAPITSSTLSTGVKLDANADQNFTEYGMARQSIMNGNFDIWQRGTISINMGDTGVIADRWKLYLSNSGTLPTTIIHSQQALTPGDIPNTKYFYRINPNGAGSGFGASDYYFLGQQIENGVSRLCGLNKKVTVSFYARSSIANKKLGVGLTQNYGTGGSPSSLEILAGQSITLTSTWTEYSVTGITNTLVGKTFGTNGDDRLGCYFFGMWGSTIGTSYGLGAAETFVGSGNIDIAQVQLCAGDVALPFQPKSEEEETRQCQRYYEQSSNGNQICWSGNTTNATLYYFPTVFYKVTKRISVTPTFSYSNISGFPVATPTVYRANADGFMTTAIANATVSGGIHIDDWVASAEL